MRFAFLPLFLLVFALLALLKFLSLLFLLAAHLIRLLLLAALEFVLTLLVCILAVQFLLLLLISPLRFLALGVLLPLHLVEVSLMLLLQPGIGGRIVGVAATSGRPWLTEARKLRSPRAPSKWRFCSAVMETWRSCSALRSSRLTSARMPPGPPLKLTRVTLRSFTTTRFS